MMTMKMMVNEYEVLRRALEEGVLRGIRRHYKHAYTQPAEDQIAAEADVIVQEQLNAIGEVFVFESHEQR